MIIYKKNKKKTHQLPPRTNCHPQQILLKLYTQLNMAGMQRIIYRTFVPIPGHSTNNIMLQRVKNKWSTRTRRLLAPHILLAACEQYIRGDSFEERSSIADRSVTKFKNSFSFRCTIWSAKISQKPYTELLGELFSLLIFFCFFN